MEFKGTKGRWEYKIIENETSFFPIIAQNEGDRIVTYVGLNDRSDLEKQELKANALLISKAPEMLEMLNEILKEDLFFQDGKETERTRKIGKLIKEATEI